MPRNAMAHTNKSLENQTGGDKNITSLSYYSSHLALGVCRRDHKRHDYQSQVWWFSVVTVVPSAFAKANTGRTTVDPCFAIWTNNHPSLFLRLRLLTHTHFGAREVCIKSTHFKFILNLFFLSKIKPATKNIKILCYCSSRLALGM